MSVTQFTLVAYALQLPTQAQKEGPHATVYLVSGEQYKGDFHDNKRHGA
jgi:hypothetical protein